MSGVTINVHKEVHSAPVQELSHWQRFTVLVWRNWHLLCSQRSKLTLCIVAPVLFALILVVLRIASAVEQIPSSEFAPITIEDTWVDVLKELAARKMILESYTSFQYSKYVPNLAVLYAPSSRRNADIMSQAAHYLHDVPILAHQTCEELRLLIQKEHYLAGVCFKKTPPELLSFALVFPTELRFYRDTFIGDNWHTHHLFWIIDRVKNRLANGENDGGYVGYIREGFIALQHAVSMGFIQLNNYRKVELPQVVIKRFPFSAYRHDPMHEDMEISISLIILMGFLYPVLHLNMFIVKDRRDKRRIIMKNAGITYVMQFMSWFLAGYTLLMVCSMLLVIVLKVHFRLGDSILPGTSPAAFMLMISFYNMASVSFSLVVAAIFKNRNSCGAFLGLFWFFTYLPYASKVSNDISPTAIEQIFLCALPNSALGLLFHNILELEKYGEGLTLQSFFDAETLDDHYSVGVYALILLVVTVVYGLVGMGIEASGGLKALFQQCCKGKLTYRDISRKQKTGTILQVDPSGERTTVELRDVSLVINGELAINQVSLTLIEHEITVLMGHNGSGKSQLLHMIIGLTPPTSGKVLIHGINVCKFNARDHFSIGSALSDSALYSDLTVAEQLMFYCHLRGFDLQKIDAEVDKFLVAMQLQENRDTLTKHLTLGMRKHLDVCCALAGDAKIVVLDEPSSGMAIQSRKLLWDMLTNEKTGRTIILSTHSVHEADSIGDRIAIMSGGILVCSGTTNFLKQIYGHGFVLTIQKADYCESLIVHDVIQKHIPSLRQMSDVANEITYYISVKYREIIHNILVEIEKRQEELGISGIVINETPLSEIYVKLGAENPSDGEFDRHSAIMNGKTTFVAEYEHYRFLDGYERLTRIRLWLRQCHTLLMKRFKHANYNRSLGLLRIVAPFIVATLTIHLTIITPMVDLPPMFYTLDQYHTTVTLLDQHYRLDPHIKTMGEMYIQTIFWHGGKHILKRTDGATMTDFFMTLQQNEHLKRINRRYVVGATIGNGTVVAWFNNFPLHSAPLSLNLLHIALARSVVNIDVDIDLFSEPLPSQYQRDGKVTIHNNTGSFLTVNVLICLCFIWTLSVIYIVSERQIGFRFQQMVAGVGSLRFWIMTFAYDLLANIISATIIIMVIRFFWLRSLLLDEVQGWYCATLIVGSCCMCIWSYLLMELMDDHCLSVYNMITIIHVYCALIFCGFSATFNSAKESVLSQTTMMFMYLIPHYSMGDALTKIVGVGLNVGICEAPDIQLVSVILEHCRSRPNCCIRHDVPKIWTWDLGVIPAYTVFMLVVSLCLAGMYLVEKPSFWHALRRRMEPSGQTRENARAEFDMARQSFDDIELSVGPALYERVKVITLQSSRWITEPLICDNVSKYYNNLPTMRGLNLVLTRGEIFGLMGPNGCGKSTVLKMVTRMEPMTVGRISVNGELSSVDDALLGYPPQRLGYAAQNDFTYPEFSIRETMWFFCLLYGIPQRRIEDICRNLAKCVGFYKFYNFRVSECSSGIVRRLCFTIALLNNPRVLCLDATTVGLDFAGRRQQWRLIEEMSSRGTTVLITLTQADECQTLCHRMAAISIGRVVYITHPTDRKEDKQLGYMLLVKMKPTELRAESIRPISRVHQLQSFMDETFPHATLHQNYQDMFIFVIPAAGRTMAEVFQKVLLCSFDIKMESFAVERTTLVLKHSELATDEYTLRKRFASLPTVSAKHYFQYAYNF